MCQASLNRWLELGSLKPGVTVAHAYPSLENGSTLFCPRERSREFPFSCLSSQSDNLKNLLTRCLLSLLAGFWCPLRQPWPLRHDNQSLSYCPGSRQILRSSGCSCHTGCYRSFITRPPFPASVPTHSHGIKASYHQLGPQVI